MDRKEFLSRLESGLSRLPKEEREEVLRYHNEYFDEAGPENVQSVIEELGDPEKLARQICAESMVRDIAGNASSEGPKKKKGLMAVWIAILAVFASPIALPVAIVLAALALSLVVVVLCLLAVPFIIVICLLFAGIASVIQGFYILFLQPAAGAWVLGAGFCMSGLGLLGLLPLIWLAEAIFRGIGRLVSRVVTRRKHA